MRSLGLFPRVFGAVFVTGLAYGLVFHYRTDYLGHYLAGFGGTLLLLSVLLLVPVPWRAWLMLAATSAAIVIGYGTESTIFRLAIFDPVDFFNQSLGAVVATATVLGEEGHIAAAAALAGSSVALLIAGFYFAFA